MNGIERGESPSRPAPVTPVTPVPEPVPVPVLVMSFRYGEEVAAATTAAGFAPLNVRTQDQALASFTAARDGDPLRLVVMDARGALTQGLAAARALGPLVQERLGALLVLLSRGDGGSALAAQDAGATSVLISPFGGDELAGALRLAARHVDRLCSVAVSAPANSDNGLADRLTGLAVGEQLEHWIAQVLAQPDPPQLYTIAIGIGRLAPLNAAYGRDVADQALAAAAARLVQIFESRTTPAPPGEQHLVARMAAAEFTLALATKRGIAEVQDLAAVVAQAFEAPVMVGDYVIHLSARAGIAMLDTTGSEAAPEAAPEAAQEAAAALVRRATSALASARTKEAGCVEIFTPHPAGDPRTRTADLEAALYRAIEGGGIHMLYQPQLSLADGRIIGVEALVRWEHPELGLLTAETLLETAASAELAVRLGRHIRANAIAEAASWSGSLGELKLSVNVTAADLSDPRFTAALDLALGSHSLARARLVLEVTEGALINDMRGTARLLEAIRATGVEVALDDFGTGYSSMAWLARLPIDTIKLDRSFTLGLTAAPREKLVVQTLINLAHMLDLDVVAEGVEDDLQLEAATAAGCDTIQGYRVAQPMDTKALVSFCEAWDRKTLKV